MNGSFKFEDVCLDTIESRNTVSLNLSWILHDGEIRIITRCHRSSYLEVMTLGKISSDP